MDRKTIPEARTHQTMPTRPRAAPVNALPNAPPSTQPGGAGTGLLFLREEQMRLAQDLFFFAYRDLTASTDSILGELDLGRAHHRALHFIGKRPGIAVSELLALLRITKQSLARVLGELVERDYVVQVRGPTDRRQRLLSLTEQGRVLERRLFERQRSRMVAAYREAGGVAVEGFRRVMRGVMDAETLQLLDRSETLPSPSAPSLAAPSPAAPSPAAPSPAAPSPAAPSPAASSPAASAGAPPLEPPLRRAHG